MYNDDEVAKASRQLYPPSTDQLNLPRDKLIATQEEKTDSPVLKSKWETADGLSFRGVGRTEKELTPGVYEIRETSAGTLFVKSMEFNVENLLCFKDSYVDKVVNDIKKFWSLEDGFKTNNILFKRGILLFGFPGGGKTSIIKLAAKDVIDNGGIVVIYNHAYLFNEGMKIFRSIQPNTQVLVIMEDLETHIHNDGENSVLNVLDGIVEIDKICFIATTNYPERLEPRIKNRPSRFDRRYEIKAPEEHIRKQYIEFLMKDLGDLYSIDKWVIDTKDLSLAHIKELFISVHLFKNDYDESLYTLKNMKKKISSEAEGRVGFV